MEILKTIGSFILSTLIPVYIEVNFSFILSYLIAIPIWSLFATKKPLNKQSFLINKKSSERKTWGKIILLTIPVYFIINALYQTGPSKNFVFGNDFQNLPNYLTFFATVLTAYLLYRTLNNQRKSNQIAEFENRFFKFMDYHRENVAQLKYRNPKSKVKDLWEGNQVFTVIYYEIKGLLKELIEEVKPEKRKDKVDAINFVFQCIFYGAGEEDGLKILESNFKNDKNIKGKTFMKFKVKKAAYSIDYLKKEVYYSGHVRRLGHYFRNIYQTINYVEEQKFLSEYQKYEYLSHFRAQMSVYEQAVFFFNSLSKLGNSWEWIHYDKNVLPKTDSYKKKLFKKLLITKYDLIRNTLNHDNGEIIEGISIKTFYPLLCIEGIEECSIFGKLPFDGNEKYICRFCFNEKYIGYPNKYLKKKIRDYFKGGEHEEILNDFKCEEENCKSITEIAKLRKNNLNKKNNG